MNTLARIEQILRKAFAVRELEITDNSHSHAGHNPDAARGGTHFTIRIVSDGFKGLPLIKRHRLVYAALKNEIDGGVHALALKTLTADEAGL